MKEQRRVSPCTINLSAHSHTIFIFYDKASNCFTHLQQNDEVSVGMTILFLLCYNNCYTDLDPGFEYSTKQKVKVE